MTNEISDSSAYSEALGKEMLILINENRVKDDLPPLEWCPDTHNLCYQNSVKISTGEQGFDYQGEKLYQQVPFPYEFVVENIQKTIFTEDIKGLANTAVQDSLKSKIRSKYLLSDKYTQIGVGTAHKDGDRLCYTTVLYTKPFPPDESEAPDPATWADSEENADKVGHEVLAALNKFRTEKGVTEVEWNEDLYTICRQHATAMGKGEKGFDHSGFDGRASQITFEKGKYSENICKLNATNNFVEMGIAVIEGWKKSTLHTRNMLDVDVNKFGCGAYLSSNLELYFSVLFVGDAQ